MAFIKVPYTQRLNSHSFKGVLIMAKTSTNQSWPIIKLAEAHGFTNLVYHCEPETTMFAEEIGLVLETVGNVLSTYIPNARRGTFIMDGQRYDDEAYCILRFNLIDGLFKYRPFGRLSEIDTDYMAAKSIDHLLAIPETSFYTDGNDQQSRVLRDSIKTARDVKSGIWTRDDLCVLVLNATHGRFLVSCLVEDDYKDAVGDGRLSSQAAFMSLYAVAHIFAKLCPEDQVLQDSIRHISDDATTIAHEQESSAAFFVATKFASDREYPALQAWQSWHDAGVAAGKLTLFFE